MGFALYKKTGENWLRKEPLKLSGVDGFISRYVKGQGSSLEQPWMLGSEEVAAILDGSVFFEQKNEQGHIHEVMVLKSMAGRTGRDQTDLTMRLGTLVTKAQLSTEELSTRGIPGFDENNAPECFLSLTLGGGLSSGNWKWKESPLALNAASAVPGRKVQ